METVLFLRKENIATPFKSYYVVWKLFFRYCIFLIIFGLNRTMQYGNVFGFADISAIIFCLNRTMQYGNDEVFKMCFPCHFRLNRTMQYGNYELSKTYTENLYLFKSYYVVWKLSFNAV